MNELAIRNRQRLMAINTRWLRRMVVTLLEDIAQVSHYELAIHAVGRKEIIHLNETFLQHAGATDVIAFDHQAANDVFNVKSENSVLNPTAGVLYGELFVCVDVAVDQARKFRTSWPKEFIRYIIHGLLHLEGYDDQAPGQKRQIKKVEDQRLKLLGRRYLFEELILNRHAL